MAVIKSVTMMIASKHSMIVKPDSVDWGRFGWSLALLMVSLMCLYYRMLWEVGRY